jgi:hypothetical protein
MTMAVSSPPKSWSNEIFAGQPRSLSSAMASFDERTTTQLSPGGSRRSSINNQKFASLIKYLHRNELDHHPKMRVYCEALKQAVEQIQGHRTALLLKTHTGADQ